MDKRELKGLVGANNTLNVRMSQDVDEFLVANAHQKLKLVQKISSEDGVSYVCNCEHPWERTLKMKVKSEGTSAKSANRRVVSCLKQKTVLWIPALGR